MVTFRTSGISSVIVILLFNLTLSYLFKLQVIFVHIESVV